MKVMLNGNELNLGGGTAQEVYSTEETRIGTWIDGKPLYRKTFSFHQTRTTDYTTLYTTIGVINDADILHMYGHIWSRSNNYKYPIPSSDIVKSSTENYSYSFQALNSAASGGIFISSNIWRGEFDGYLTVEYTKSTD